MHYDYWERYLLQKKDCRMSVSSPFPLFFNTLNDRLVISGSAFDEYFNL